MFVTTPPVKMKKNEKSNRKKNYAVYLKSTKGTRFLGAEV
jgi:hypothetical protein